MGSLEPGLFVPIAALAALALGCGAAAQGSAERLMREPVATSPRGYLTTPGELREIAEKARLGLEPYKSAVAKVLAIATHPWEFSLRSNEVCPNADEPAWIDDGGGTPILYAKALAFHLTGESAYAAEVRSILESIMSRVKSISTRDRQCELNFAWGTPELVASADLIEDYWKDAFCTGPVSTRPWNRALDRGNCKVLFQNWLVKNPYYVFSEATTRMAGNNWGAAATNAAMHVSDYLWDRPDARLRHRNPVQENEGRNHRFSPAEAYGFNRQVTLERMNMHRVSWTPRGCDNLKGSQQSPDWPPVKSGITENGIVSDDARREQFCNVPRYDGRYQNYPEIHLGNLIQQCELMLRRGDSACYDNVEESDRPEYRYLAPDGSMKTTHLYPGRGSLERAIDAVIVDAGAAWQRPGALWVALGYYFHNRRWPETDLVRWAAHLESKATECRQDVCFGTLTHGFASGETPRLLPPTTPPPGGEVR